MRLLLSSPIHLVSLGFGSGLAPVAPGTFGTLVGFLLFWSLAYLPLSLRIPAYVLLFTIGCWLCAKTGATLGKHDHSAIVWDEMLAMSLVLEFAPGSWLWWLAAFLLFRLFDIWKPWPIRLADKARGATEFSGGFFVMLDDILAAAYAIAILTILQYMLP